jgi:hypothetical protein
MNDSNEKQIIRASLGEVKSFTENRLQTKFSFRKTSLSPILKITFLSL